MKQTSSKQRIFSYHFESVSCFSCEPLCSELRSVCFSPTSNQICSKSTFSLANKPHAAVTSDIQTLGRQFWALIFPKDQKRIQIGTCGDGGKQPELNQRHSEPLDLLKNTLANCHPAAGSLHNTSICGTIWEKLDIQGRRITNYFLPSSWLKLHFHQSFSKNKSGYF